MAPGNETTRNTVNWTEEATLNLCEFLITSRNKNGRIQWAQLQPEYEKKYNIKFGSEKSLKSKYDGMRKQYSLWKYLKNTATGLGWDATTGRLSCSDEWWAIKTAENSNASSFRTKPPSKELQEAWDQLFGDAIANGSKVVGPAMDRVTSSEVPKVNREDVSMEINDDTDPYEVFHNISDHLTRLNAQENDFYPSLMRDVGQDVPASSQNEIPGQPNKSINVTTKPKIVAMKRKGRSTRGSSLFNDFMIKQDEKQERVIKILESDVSRVTKDDPYSISRCMSVINGMIDGKLIIDDGPLLYLAMDLFKDGAERELFMSMRSDDARLKWLQHNQDRAD